MQTASWILGIIMLAVGVGIGVFWRRRSRMDINRYLESAVVERTRELLQAQEALRRSNEVLETTIRAAPVGIVVLDPSGNVQLWNEMTEAAFGWKQDEVLNRPSPFLKSQRQTEFSDLLARVSQGESISGHEASYSRKDGTQIAARVFAAPVRDLQSEETGVLLVFEDVTERKSLESQLFQSQKLESIGKLAGGIAHDFNNLLTIINGYADMALSRIGKNDPACNQIQQIRKAGGKAANLAEQLLIFSRKKAVEMKPLDLNMAVVDIEKMLRRLIGEDIHMVTSLDTSLGTVMGDAGQVQQVIMNLAINARDAMPGGGKLVIETSNVEVDATFSKRHPQLDPGAYVLLAVTDTGIGMDDETKSHIFEPFFTTKEPGKGTGLGLATVYGIVRQSRGWIWVYSEPGRGTTFKIYLPRCDARAEDGHCDRAEAADAHGTERILLVEDDVGVLSLVGNILRGLGYTVVEASNGEEALAICGQDGGKIDMMISDVVMPGISGYDLARRLKGIRPSLAVLFISGYADRTVAGAHKVDPNTPYLQKPFTSASLASRVREILDARQPAAQPGHFK